MTQEEYNSLESIAYGDKPFQARKSLQNFIKTVKVVSIEEAPKGTYTGQQRNASWLYITQKADQLNLAGLDMRVVLKPTYNIPWTKDNFHDHVWIPVQRALFGTESMRDLKKDQVGRIHELLERELGEKHGLEYLPFPNFNARMSAVDNANSESYPEYSGEPVF